jgi:enamine deaminase RidA (YjgF/YER057c/UK114 family)
MTVEIVNPAGLAPPRGYAHGAVGQGRVLHVGGQIGWEADETFASEDFVHQFGRALDNVLAVVRAAGGAPEDIARMTVYVTDMPAYRASLRELGRAWRERLGRHYPAMALVGVQTLVHPQAKVEIEAVAHLEGEAR